MTCRATSTRVKSGSSPCSDHGIGLHLSQSANAARWPSHLISCSQRSPAGVSFARLATLCSMNSGKGICFANVESSRAGSTRLAFAELGEDAGARFARADSTAFSIFRFTPSLPVPADDHPPALNMLCVGVHGITARSLPTIGSRAHGDWASRAWQLERCTTARGWRSSLPEGADGGSICASKIPTACQCGKFLGAPARSLGSPSRLVQR
jgi:hypothetical protein